MGSHSSHRVLHKAGDITKVCWKKLLLMQRYMMESGLASAQPFATSCTLPTRGENDLLQSFAFLQSSMLKHFILTILIARVTVETESR